MGIVSALQERRPQGSHPCLSAPERIPTLYYLDESGDLGWTFDRPYRFGGSSRYLTIAALIVDPARKQRPKRVVRKLYKKYKWDPARERKWAELTGPERTEFARRAAELADRFPGEVAYKSITVRKEQVQPHIRQDANKLYNYMIKCMLIDHMAQHDSVHLLPDPRSIKVESGNSLHDYLQTTLWFEKAARTDLHTTHLDSAQALNIQFADMLAGVVQSHFEDGNSNAWRILSARIQAKTLFF